MRVVRVIRDMRFSVFLLAFAAQVAAGQQPAAAASAPTPPPSDSAKATRDTLIAIPLDRVVAVVGDQPTTQYDVQARVILMNHNPNFKAPATANELRALQ